jgi:hypothetical protein
MRSVSGLLRDIDAIVLVIIVAKVNFCILG